MVKPIALAFCAFSIALSGTAADLKDPAVAGASSVIREDAIRAAMRFLADDLLEGREAATRGHHAAALYMATQFEALGLEPGGEGGTFFQDVPFRASRVVESESSFGLVGRRKTDTLVAGRDYVIGSSFYAPVVSIDDAPVAFVGFGVSAPEFGYDDYRGIDVRGKVVVTLKGAPPAFPNDPRAYYSSTMIKAQNAAARGAIGIIRIQTPQDWTSTPWERFIDRKDEWGMRWFADGKIGNGVPEIRFNAVMSPAGTETLFAGAKRPLSAVFDAGTKAKPDSFDLPWKVRARVVGELKETRSPNVAAILRGSDPLLSSEYVVYTAHLDHEGMGRAVAGDSIFNGAYDNASGCAAMIEVARAFTALPERPRRSILFLAVTAEEKGLQGADYFANYPTVPVERIVANLNMDMFLALTPVADVVGFGAEHSTLGKVLERAAGEVGFTVSPDFAPEEVVFIRSDQFPFVKKGIPAIFVTNGVGSLDPAVDGRKLVMEWMVRTYHSRSDDMGQPIHFPSLKRFAELNFLAGFVVASEPAPPRWNDGDFFARKFSRTHN